MTPSTAVLCPAVCRRRHETRAVCAVKVPNPILSFLTDVLQLIFHVANRRFYIKPVIFSWREVRAKPCRQEVTCQLCKSYDQGETGSVNVRRNFRHQNNNTLALTTQKTYIINTQLQSMGNVTCTLKTGGGGGGGGGRRRKKKKS